MMGQSDRCDSVDQLLQELAIKRDRPILAICGDMTWDSVIEVRKFAETLDSCSKLSVLLHSPGGDIEAAYRMVIALREYVTDMEVLVPLWAKSAATFFCLAANSIHMGQHGELGPLDPQQLSTSGSVMRKSALETFKALEQTLGYSLDSLNGVVKHIIALSPNMDMPFVLEHARPYFAAIVSPLYSMADLHELGEAGRALAIGEEYARIVMERWGYADRESKEIRMIVRHLVWDYPTHGFVIDCMQAQSIGLNVEKLPKDHAKLCEAVSDVVGLGTVIKAAFPTAAQEGANASTDPVSSGGVLGDGEENGTSANEQ